MATAESEGQVIGCHTIEEWKQQLEKGNDNKKLIVVDFTASWCAPCRFIGPFFAELAKKLPDVTFLKVDVDELKSVASDWAVEAMPTFLLLKEGKILERVVGARKDDLQKAIEKHHNAVREDEKRKRKAQMQEANRKKIMKRVERKMAAVAREKAWQERLVELKRIEEEKEAAMV